MCGDEARYQISSLNSIITIFEPQFKLPINYYYHKYC